MPPNPAPILLLTRPEPASRRFAAGLAHLGLEVLISPVLRIRPVAHDAARLAAARAAGFDVTEGPGDAARMLPLLKGLGQGWLHPHGAHVAKELPVPDMVVYDQLPEPLNAAALAALAGARPVILPLFSPRSARLLSGQAAGARAPLWLAPISAAAQQAWQGPAARSVPAPTPDAEGVLCAVERLLATEQSI